jgi:hypothetical protein
MTIHTGLMLGHWGQRFYWFRGKHRFLFSIGLGLFWVEVRR